ncbi:hypothetical protein [Bdellovibrio sp.]|uniref:hypothetical protein n=1 Tax=Bdellovibrio sp. TaxID=28201 RepID=UPI0039E6B8BA
MSGDSENPKERKLNHDLKELAFWLHTLKEALDSENVSEPVRKLAADSAKRLEEILGFLKSPR